MSVQTFSDRNCAISGSLLPSLVLLPDPLRSLPVNDPASDFRHGDFLRDKSVILRLGKCSNEIWVGR